MDGYIHPFTSGGFELPCFENKLAGCLSAVTNYSCGEEICSPGSQTIPLDWREYREPGSEFIKASTLPESIATAMEQIMLVKETDPEQYKRIGSAARQWVLDNFSVEKVGEQIRGFIDAAPLVENFDFLKEDVKNPDYNASDNPDDTVWLKELYYNILNMNVENNDSGLQFWIGELGKSEDKMKKRAEIVNYFKSVAKQENLKKEGFKIEYFLGNEGWQNRIAIIIPEAIGDIFLCTALFKGIKELYPKENLYIVTKQEYFDVVTMNPYIHKVIPYTGSFDNLIWLEGAGTSQGFFKVAYLPYAASQRFLTYMHNGENKVAYNILF